MRNILLAVFVFFIIGCIEDNGNYDYNPIRDLKVEDLPSRITLEQGESVVVKPKLFERNDKSKTLIEGAKYKWYVSNELVSEDSVFTYIAKEKGSYDCMLNVIDPLTGGIFYQGFGIDVQSKYIDGILILSEENNKPMLSMIRVKSQREPKPTFIYDGEWKDVYKVENGEELKGTPISINEHWGHNDYDACIGEITLVTEENGKRIVQELNGESMKRETYIEQEFTNGEIPANFSPKSVEHTQWDSYILDESGDVYIRRSAVESAYHTGYFSSRIKLWGDKKFTDILFTYFPAIKALLALELNEDGSRDYVGIYSSEWNARNNLTRLDFIGESGDFKNITEEIVAHDYSAEGVSVLMKAKNGDYILHRFDMEEANYRTGIINVTKSDKMNLTSEKGLGKVNGICTNKRFNYSYIWDDNAIYALNNKHIGDFNIVNKFDKKIVSVADYSIVYDDPDPGYPTSLIIAFEDGSIEIWEIDLDNPMKFSRMAYKTKENYGKIVSVINKVGDAVKFYELNY